MRRAENVYTQGDAKFAQEQASRQPGPPLEDLASKAKTVWQGALGELGEDAVQVGSALTTFPYGSAFKIIGVITVAFVALNLLGKFGIMKDKLQRLMR